KMSFTIVTALLLSSFSWISISVSESQTVEVQSGEEATLLCSNFTTSPSQIIWFRLTNRTQPRCISSIYTATDPASLCSGVQEGKYEMRSNISTVFLKMKDVDSSDSGLYFCGYYISRHPVIVRATYLKVQGKNITTVFIYCVFICLCNYCPNKTTKLQTAQLCKMCDWKYCHLQNVDSEYLMRLYSPTIRNRRPASEREVETHVIYTASRETQSGTDALSYYHSFSLTGV
uniref:Ig-like domain-containing protein n=1 Tax=Lates calcarifer TaxID=8187 RepID=A0A4W6BLY8_LATCA